MVFFRTFLSQWLVLTLFALASACQQNERTCHSESAKLFGQPSENTGLSEAQCAPRCNHCGDAEFAPPEYSIGFVDWLLGRTHQNPPERLGTDPYSIAYEPEVSGSGLLCIAIFEADGVQYRLETQPEDSWASTESQFVTHRNGCGQCSSLQDLAVYIGNPDLTGPVRACGAQGFTDGEEAQRQCLLDIGFSEPCADIWLYNILNTRRECLASCLEYFDLPHHLADGSLNPCIQCDEDESGPIFKLVSGRTRRNSGLASGLCRPCETVFPLTHSYGFDSSSSGSGR